MLFALLAAAFAIAVWAVMRTSGPLEPASARSPVGPVPQHPEGHAFGGLYESVFKSIADALIVIDDHGLIRSFSPSAERIFGYASAEVLGRNVSVLMPAPDRDQHDEYVRKYVESGWASGRLETLVLTGDARIIRPEREIVAARKDGTPFPARLIVSEVETDGNRWFVGLISDVSERKRLEQEVTKHVEAQDTLLQQLREAYRLIDSWKQRVQYELDVGREIQLSMVPHRFPQLASADVWATLRPAREVGGDFYDVLATPTGQLWVWVGDVSGKGVPAALLMAVTKTLIRSCVSRGMPPAEVMSAVNTELSRDNDSSMFVTAFLSRLDLASGALCYVNAGHNPPLVQRREGRTDRLDGRHGLALGLMEHAVYAESEAHLAAEDILLLYTDGVTEAWDDDEQMFAESRLVDVLSQERNLSVQDLTNSVVSAVESFVNGVDQADDITVLVVRFHGHDAGAQERRIPFRIATSLDVLPAALDDVERLVASLGGDEAMQRRFGIAFDELVGNIINHGNGTTTHIDCEIGRKDGALVAVIEDDGPAFDPLSLPSPDIKLSLEDRQVGGLGVHLVRRLFDEVRYERHDGRNVVTIVQCVRCT